MKPTPSARTGLKAAVVSAGAVLLLSSGVAFAATGHTPWQAADTPAGGRTSATSEAPSDASTAGTKGPASTAGTPSTAGSDPAAQAFRGLCRAYQSGNKTLRGQALQSPAFDALVIAAGGADQVATFCADVTALPPTHPTHPSHPTHPTHSTHPTGGPTTEATQPGASSDPTHPPHPSHPTHPSQPTHPTHPTQGADPTPGAEATHPPHPTHPAHPTHS